MFKNICLVPVFLLILNAAFAQEVEFNYNGRVKVEGHAFTGTGSFKFALVNKDGDKAFWANDGVTLTGEEPLSAITSDVKEGFFTVNIGDTNTTNMAPLDASLFNSKQKIFLRSWFSDGIHGFERLKPDRQVVNPALLGTRSYQEINLYIDPASGNDLNSGLKPNQSKKTIQAAWNDLPPMLDTTATLHLADGTYRESVRLKGKNMLGDGLIRIIGNPDNPEMVRLTGSTEQNDTVAALEYGFLIVGLKSLHITGIFFDYYANTGIDTNSASEIEVTKCVFKHSLKGIRLAEKCIMKARNLDMTGTGKNVGWSAGIEPRTFCVVDIYYCHIRDFNYGVGCHQSYVAYYGENSISNCYYGASVGAHGYMGFPMAGMDITNCTIGVDLDLVGVATFANASRFSGNGTNIRARNGSIVSN